MYHNAVVAAAADQWSQRSLQSFLVPLSVEMASKDLLMNILMTT